MDTILNAIGRPVPTELDGRTLKPFSGLSFDTSGGKQYSPKIPAACHYKNKLLDSLDKAIDACDIKDGMTLSFHHHLRNGDGLINLVMKKLADRGIKNLVLAPSALFPVHETLIHERTGGTSLFSGQNAKSRDFAFAWRTLSRYSGW